MTTMDSFRKCRNMPFVKRGMRIIHTHNGKHGTITGANSGCNLNIRFDGCKFSVNCHPKFMLKYLDKNGKVIAEYGK